MTIIAVLLIIAGLVTIVLAVRRRKDAEWNVGGGGGAPIFGSGPLANELSSFLDNEAEKDSRAAINKEKGSADAMIALGVVLCIVGTCILIFL